MGCPRHVRCAPGSDRIADLSDRQLRANNGPVSLENRFSRCNPVTGHRHTSRSRRFSADNKLERRSNNVPIRKLRQRNLTKLEKGRNLCLMTRSSFVERIRPNPSLVTGQLSSRTGELNLLIDCAERLSSERRTDQAS
jgi:hypothetical protein